MGTVDAKLVYDGIDGDGLHGYTDSSLGDQTDDYHSKYQKAWLEASDRAMYLYCCIVTIRALWILQLILSQAAPQSTSQLDIMSLGNMLKEGTSP